MNSLSQLSQPPQPTEPDMALLYLGSLFETVDCTLPLERDEAKLDALAWHILNRRPKTLLGLAIRARGGEAALPVSLVGRLRHAPALRSGCSCRHRVYDAAVIPPQ